MCCRARFAVLDSFTADSILDGVADISWNRPRDMTGGGALPIPWTDFLFVLLVIITASKFVFSYISTGDAAEQRRVRVEAINKQQ